MTMTNRLTLSITAAVALAAGAGAALAAEAHISAVDTDGDGLASLAEFRVLYPAMPREIFAKLDLDGDGMVDAGELAEPLPQDVLAAIGLVNDGPVLTSADLDNDGAISHDELVRAAPGITAEQFAAFDVNDDGTLGMVEFNAGRTQEALSAAEDATIYLRVQDHDTDGDGRLSLQELQAALPGRDVTALRAIDSDTTVRATGLLHVPVAQAIVTK